MSDAMPASRRNSGLSRAIVAIDRGLSALDGLAMTLVGAMMLGMMIIVSVDAVLRYGFNRPLIFASDLVTLYLLPGAMFLALSYTLRKGGHIGVDVFVTMMPTRLYNFVTGIVLLVAVPVLAIMGWHVCQLSFDSWSGQEMMTGLYEWPLWPSKLLVAVSLVVVLVRVFFTGITHLIAGFLRQEELAIPIMPSRGEAAEDAV